MNKEQLVKLLKNANKDALKMIYVDYREPFLNFARTLHFSENDIVDVYQDAIIVLQQKAINGDLDDLKCAIKTYLFGIGKYLLVETSRKHRKRVYEMAKVKILFGLLTFENDTKQILLLNNPYNFFIPILPNINGLIVNNDSFWMSLFV